MFSFLKRKKQQAEPLQEFTFIWYKKMLNGNTVHYTAPYRTKVKAATREEAVEKLTNFALNKMTLSVHEEKDFDASDLMQLSKKFESLNRELQERLDKMNEF